MDRAVDGHDRSGPQSLEEPVLSSTTCATSESARTQTPTTSTAAARDAGLSDDLGVAEELLQGSGSPGPQGRREPRCDDGPCHRCALATQPDEAHLELVGVIGPDPRVSTSSRIKASGSAARTAQDVEDLRVGRHEEPILRDRPGGPAGRRHRARASGGAGRRWARARHRRSSARRCWSSPVRGTGTSPRCRRGDRRRRGPRRP